jgi:hypothetical protein
MGLAGILDREVEEVAIPQMSYSYFPSMVA